MSIVTFRSSGLYTLRSSFRPKNIRRQFDTFRIDADGWLLLERCGHCLLANQEFDLGATPRWSDPKGRKFPFRLIADYSGTIQVFSLDPLVEAEIQFEHGRVVHVGAQTSEIEIYEGPIDIPTVQH